MRIVPPEGFGSSLEEIVWDVATLHHSIQQMLLRVNVSTVQLMAAWDSNGDGELSKAEVLEHIHQFFADCKPGVWESELKAVVLEAFDAMDSHVRMEGQKPSAMVKGKVDIIELQRWIAKPCGKHHIATKPSAAKPNATKPSANKPNATKPNATKRTQGQQSKAMAPQAAIGEPSQEGHVAVRKARETKRGAAQPTAAKAPVASARLAEGEGGRYRIRHVPLPEVLRSPRQEMHSPRQEMCSPRQEMRSPRQEMRSPRQEMRSPRHTHDQPILGHCPTWRLLPNAGRLPPRPRTPWEVSHLPPLVALPRACFGMDLSPRFARDHPPVSGLPIWYHFYAEHRRRSNGVPMAVQLATVRGAGKLERQQCMQLLEMHPL